MLVVMLAVKHSKRHSVLVVVCAPQHDGWQVLLFALVLGACAGAMQHVQRVIAVAVRF